MGELAGGGDGDAILTSIGSFSGGASTTTTLFRSLPSSYSSQINSRSNLNHFAFHLSNPLNIFFRNICLKYLSKNDKFLENYLGKVYSN